MKDIINALIAAAKSIKQSAVAWLVLVLIGTIVGMGFAIKTLWAKVEENEVIFKNLSQETINSQSLLIKYQDNEINKHYQKDTTK